MLHTPAHHSPSTLYSPLRLLHTGSGSSHGESPVSAAAKLQQANRCSPRAYLIPPGIFLILVSHAFNRPRYRAPVTLLLWPRRSKDDCARSSCLPAAITYIHHPPCSRRTKRHRTLARNETNRRPGRGGPLLLRPYAWRRGQACATCGLSDLSICEHKHFTALCPPPQEAALQQTGRRRCAPFLLHLAALLTANKQRAREKATARRRLRGKLVAAGISWTAAGDRAAPDSGA